MNQGKIASVFAVQCEIIGIILRAHTEPKRGWSHPLVSAYRTKKVDATDNVHDMATDALGQCRVLRIKIWSPARLLGGPPSDNGIKVLLGYVSPHVR
jgi:hypothetical protein